MALIVGVVGVSKHGSVFDCFRFICLTLRWLLFARVPRGPWLNISTQRFRRLRERSSAACSLPNHFVTSSATSWSASSWFISSPRSSHLPSVIITTVIIHHPIILPFQTQNFPISQILPSIDMWHLFGLISRIPGLLYGFFLFRFFSSFQLSYLLPFKFFCLRSLISPITVCFLIFIFYFF